MTTLASTLINRILKGFRVSDNPDILAVAMDDSQATLTYTGVLSGWGASTIAEVEGELLLVMENDATSKVATVVRGWLGTTPAAHAQNTPIYLNPRMLRSDVLDLINDCLDDLFGRDLYAIDTKSVSYSSGLIGYDLDVDAIEIIRVDALKDSSSKLWEPVHDWELLDNQDPTEFASGRAIMLRASLPFGSTFRVTYAKPFTALSDESEDLEADAGLRPYMTKLPFYFAMNRLMVDSERSRSQMKSAQSHQRAQDSPPFLALRTGEWYQARYNDRIATARNHLRREVHRVRGTGYGS